ncbi:hypothetical protein ES705_20323 [subsurface metagenome]
MELLSFKENILFSIVRILVVKEDRKAFAGTSFIVNYKHNEINYPFLVTNKHIVKDSSEGKILLRNEDKKKEGPVLELNFESDFQKLWTFHDNV